jgi:hypothetical protein
MAKFPSTERNPNPFHNNRLLLNSQNNQSPIVSLPMNRGNMLSRIFKLNKKKDSTTSTHSASSMYYSPTIQSLIQRTDFSSSSIYYSPTMKCILRSEPSFSLAVSNPFQRKGIMDLFNKAPRELSIGETRRVQGLPDSNLTPDPRELSIGEICVRREINIQGLPDSNLTPDPDSNVIPDSNVSLFDYISISSTSERSSTSSYTSCPSPSPSHCPSPSHSPSLFQSPSSISSPLVGEHNLLLVNDILVKMYPYILIGCICFSQIIQLGGDVSDLFEPIKEVSNATVFDPLKIMSEVRDASETSDLSSRVEVEEEEEGYNKRKAILIGCWLFSLAITIASGLSKS